MRAIDVDVHCGKAVGETFCDKTLPCEVITLIKIVLADDVINARITLESCGMKNQTINDVGKPTKARARRFERDSSHKTMDFVSQVQKIFGKITTVLTGYACNEGFLCHALASIK